ncbi:hypothetical protein, partial [Escherichia coli]|uniref:hypothetical protein n=1 Tax=Escherichia coli TaxID=562 RepID=UPI002F92237A
MIAFCAMMLSCVANYEMIIPIMCVSAPKSLICKSPISHLWPYRAFLSACKDVERKLTTTIIFFASKQLKTINYAHDDDDDKITKMRFFPRLPPRVAAHPPRRRRKKA